MYLARDRTQPGCDCYRGLEIFEIHIGMIETLNK
jgi:hypothetical protein